MTRKMIYLLPMICWNAISLAMYGSMFVPLFIKIMDKTPETEILSPEIQERKCLFALAALGVGAVVGSLSIGKVTDKLG